MKKIFILFWIFLLALSMSAQAELIYYQNVGSDTVDLVPVSTINKLPVDSEVTIGSMSIETNITPITYWATQTLTLVANTAQDITTVLTSTNRRFIELKSHDPSDVFWIDFGATAVINASRPCDGYFYGEVPIGITVSVIASTAYDIAVTEGGDD